MTSLALVEKCCLLTDDAAGDPTHFMIRQAFAQLDLDWRFLSFEIDPARLADALTGVDVLDFRGVLLSAALREQACRLWEEQTADATRSGGVNMLLRLGDQLVGDNTVVGAVRQAVGDFTGQHVVILGSGSVARTFASAAVTAQPASLVLVSRDEESLGRLSADLGEVPGGQTVATQPLGDEEFQIPAETTLLLCADYQESQTPVDCESVTSSMTIVDSRLSSSRTLRVRAATERGAHTVDGVTLLANEVSLAVERWTGETLDRTTLRDAAEEFLGV